MRKFGITGYGDLFGTLVRASVAMLDSGAVVLVREDGTNSILPAIPTKWRTSGDVVNVVSRSAEAFVMGAIPAASVAAHGHARKATKGRKAYKATRTFRQHALHMVRDAALVDALIAGLKVTYEAEDSAELAA